MRSSRTARNGHAPTLGRRRARGLVLAGERTAFPRKASGIPTWSHPQLRAITKRAFDIAVASTVLVLAAVPLLVIALLVKLESPGPILYRVHRVGHRTRPLRMLKFRKMQDNATGSPLTADGDTRLTRVGRVLARTRADELPQLWDVLRGRMSIVGPRPEDPVFVALHAGAYDHILRVRPGITGLSQLAFAAEHKILDQSDMVNDYVARILPQKVRLDMLYADRYSLRMDLSILGWTIAAVLLRRPVAVHRESGLMSLRRRPRIAAVHPAASREPAVSMADAA